VKNRFAVEVPDRDVDKNLGITLSEVKPEPDYSKTGLFSSRALVLMGKVADTAFAALLVENKRKRTVMTTH